MNRHNQKKKIDDDNVTLTGKDEEQSVDAASNSGSGLGTSSQSTEELKEKLAEKESR